MEHKWNVLPVLGLDPPAACCCSCLLNALAAMKTFAGLSQPPPNTPYPFFGWGWIRNSSTGNSSLSTQWMQFTGHESTETWKFMNHPSDKPDKEINVLFYIFSVRRYSVQRDLYLNILVTVPILNLYSCTSGSFIHNKCVTGMVYTFSAPCDIIW